MCARLNITKTISDIIFRRFANHTLSELH